eukprot:jgi/Botrbrau1/14927/Bobra.0018s0031.1
MSARCLHGCGLQRCQVVKNGSRSFHASFYPFNAVKASKVSRKSHCRASEDHGRQSVTVLEEKPQEKAGASGGFSLGDVLGPIGLTFSSLIESKAAARTETKDVVEVAEQQAFADNTRQESSDSHRQDLEPSTSGGATASSIHSLTTEEWRNLYEPDGYIDLWVEEEFNAGSRLVGGRDAHKGSSPGAGSGRVLLQVRLQYTLFASSTIMHLKTFKFKCRRTGTFLWEAEEQGLLLPYACRMGCCTACAVRVKEGQMYQPQSLGVSAELRARGYALMCVGFPLSDLVLETVGEDEVYDLQFGSVFAEKALDPSDQRFIEADPFALEIANMDE